MKLGIKMLDSESTVNSLSYINQLEMLPGETATVMFQLINDATKQRYIPEAGATMSVQTFSINNANQLTKVPSQPFAADDRSIWSFTLSSADTSKLAGVNLQITLTEGANIKKVWAQSVIVVAPSTPFRA